MIEYENLHRFNKPFLRAFKRSFAASLKRGWFILGENVLRFEQEFSAYVGTRYCIGAANGLDALILALRALDLEEKSEIIVPSNTYIATILAILHNRLTPVLVEPDIQTYNIDPSRIEEKITSKTRAIIVVHLYGKPCEMSTIMDICRRHKLKLIEDCAQSHGAKFEGRMTGSFGDMGCFSFYPTKNLGCLGDGGAVLTDNPDYKEILCRLRNYGSAKKYYNDLIGYNSRLDEVQAGFLSVKLRRLDDIISHKRKLAALYSRHLRDDFIKPVVTPSSFDVYHIYNIRSNKREALIQHLLRHGIKSDIHYPVPPHQQKAMAGYLSGNYPISEEIHRTTLSLPISYFHRERDILKVIKVMNAF